MGVKQSFVVSLAAAAAMLVTASAFALGTRAAIEAADAEFSAAVSKGDSKAVAALYTADAQVLPAQSDAIKGNAAIQAFFQKDLLDAGVGAMTLKTSEVFGQRNFATEVGEYDLRDKSGNSIDHGKYVVLWKLTGTQWKLHRDIFTSSVPPKK